MRLFKNNYRLKDECAKCLCDSCMLQRHPIYNYLHCPESDCAEYSCRPRDICRRYASKNKYIVFRRVVPAAISILIIAAFMYFSR